LILNQRTEVIKEYDLKDLPATNKIKENKLKNIKRKYTNKQTCFRREKFSECKHLLTVLCLGIRQK
jgi:hypothetical protein